MVWTPRATVAAVIERDGRFLMVEEPSADGTVFNQPAGHLEKDETLLQAVIREVNEETAWQFTPEYVLGVYQWQHPTGSKTYMRTTYVGRVDNHRPDQTLEDGIIQALWLSKEELLERSEQLRSPMVMACVDDYLKGNRYPLELYQPIA
jgi:8-oxo-dGTP pyrophosphatase MutT (NUDIX family)